ncbi:ATP-binding protein [Leucobacter allii]|uniref:ATP-binding protein n=1 Tax=Leucobacter allii TaxID=2932247 RepID=A0ABY4FLX7_9MICO|nr:ATP-binding protein [Leucobacter allii]UOQ57259.1 ATP-binding protein [Leucobacter allii]
MDNESVVFDLSWVTFIDPAFAVSLTSRVALFCEFGISVVVLPPATSDAAVYASRLQLPEMLGRLGSDARGFPTISSNHIPERILELQDFRGPEGLEALAEQVGLHVRDEAATDGLRDCLFEAGQNVYQHSGKNQGFVAAQFYPKVGRYRFAIADSGMGYRASLAAAHSPSDDAEAIDLAMTKGISGTGKETRGLGLSEVRHIVTSHGGWVSVTSGTVTKTFNDPEEKPASHRVGDYVPGTVLEGCIRSRYGIHGR